jgi:sodium/proline symporter
MPVALPAIATFFVYLAAMMGIGVWVYQRNKSLSDFVLGGRSLGSWVSALSAQASDMSAFLLIGLPSAAYIGGLGAGWIAVGLMIGTYFNWKLIASRLRVYTERAGHEENSAGSITLSEYFENRFEDRSHLLRVISGLAIIIFYTVYVSSGLVAGGILFNEVFGLSNAVAITVAIVVIISYTFLGGFAAVSLTDFFQGSLMWIAIIAVPVFAVIAVGGVGSVVSGIESANSALLSVTGNVELGGGGWTSGSSLSGIGIVAGLTWGLGYFGQPHILARFMGIRSHTEVPKARKIATIWVVTGLSAAIVVGLVAIVYFEQPLSNPETAFINLVQETVNPWIGGILLAGVLAAVMSTADSQLLVASSALSEDFYRTFLNRDASDMLLLWIGRFTVIGVAIVAYILALQGGSVLGLVSYAWAGFGATFGPIIIMSLFWRKMNRVGAIAGMVSGGLTVLIWNFIPFLSSTEWYELLPGFLIGFACIFLFNPLGAAPSQGMEDDFEAVQSELNGAGESSG